MPEIFEETADLIEESPDQEDVFETFWRYKGEAAVNILMTQFETALRVQERGPVRLGRFLQERFANDFGMVRGEYLEHFGFSETGRDHGSIIALGIREQALEQYNIERLVAEIKTGEYFREGCAIRRILSLMAAFSYAYSGGAVITISRRAEKDGETSKENLTLDLRKYPDGSRAMDIRAARTQAKNDLYPDFQGPCVLLGIPRMDAPEMRGVVSLFEQMGARNLNSGADAR